MIVLVTSPVLTAVTTSPASINGLSFVPTALPNTLAMYAPFGELIIVEPLKFDKPHTVNVDPWCNRKCLFNTIAQDNNTNIITTSILIECITNF